MFIRPIPGLAGLALAFFALRLAGGSPAWVGRLAATSHRLVPLASAALKRPGPLGRFAFGANNGLLPCGLVYAALAMPIAGAAPDQGALAMLAFGLGEVPAQATASAAVSALPRRAPHSRRRRLPRRPGQPRLARSGRGGRPG